MTKEEILEFLKENYVRAQKSYSDKENVFCCAEALGILSGSVSYLLSKNGLLNEEDYLFSIGDVNDE